MSKARLSTAIPLALASLAVAGGGCGGSSSSGDTSSSATESTSQEQTRSSERVYECLERSPVAAHVTAARYEPDPRDTSRTVLVIETTIAPGDYDTGVPIVSAAYDCQDRATAITIIDRNGDELA